MFTATGTDVAELGVQCLFPQVSSSGWGKVEAICWGQRFDSIWLGNIKGVWPIKNPSHLSLKFHSPFPQIDIVGAMMIVRRIRGKNVCQDYIFCVDGETVGCKTLTQSILKVSLTGQVVQVQEENLGTT